MKVTAYVKGRKVTVGEIRSGYFTKKVNKQKHLLRKLDAAAAETGARPELLIQVDLAGEVTKFGASPDAVPALLEAAAGLRAARVVGLMTLPPVPQEPEDARPWFQRLRTLRDGWLAGGMPPDTLRELSMGMSGDYEVAVQEGATIVRVGTAIFGSRVKTNPA